MTASGGGRVETGRARCHGALVRGPHRAGCVQRGAGYAGVRVGGNIACPILTDDSPNQITTTKAMGPMFEIADRFFRAR
jgi:hypothetical protein